MNSVQFISVAQLCLILRPHGLQHVRLPCPSSTPRAYSNSYPLSWWGHPTISSSVVRFSSCFQSFPASEFFPRSQFFASGGQSIRISALASVLPVNIQDWFPLGWTGWVSLLGCQNHSTCVVIKLHNLVSGCCHTLLYRRGNWGKRD